MVLGHLVQGALGVLRQRASDAIEFEVGLAGELPVLAIASIPQLRRGELELVLEDYEVQDAATWIVYPAREHLPTRVRFLIDFLADRLKRSEHLIEHVDRKPS